MSNNSSNKLLEVKNLKKHFLITDSFLSRNKQYLHAVDDVSFYIKEGETLGLVGESGCGKSTVGRTIIRLYNPTAGQVILDGKDITHLNEKQLFNHRSKMQMIFQDPYASLNPRMTVSEIICEGLITHGLIKDRKTKQQKVNELLHQVGLKKEHANRYPHEFSGGQRQRIGIARSLAVKPKLIICDEPISALDVSIQAQVVNMLSDLQQKFELTYLFIAHDLSMVKYISDRVAVMYLGKLVEMADCEELYQRPLHPYTQALLSSIPIPDPKIAQKNQRIVLQGDVKSPINPKPGCNFASRCRFAKEQCFVEIPKLERINDRLIACHFVNEING